MPVVTFLESPQFSFKVASCPIEDVIQHFSSDGSNQPFNERMRQGNVWDRFQLGDFKNPQVGAPLSEFKQWIVIAARADRQGNLAGNDLVEHPADSGPVDITGVRSESDDASGELVHSDAR